MDVQDGALLLTPQPEKYAAQLAGLHHEIWADVDRDEYLRPKRDAWGIPRTGWQVYGDDPVPIIAL